MASLLHSEIAGYLITDQIGSGGMGEVYKGYHRVLGRTAAIKVLHQKEMAARFRNEAFIQSGIQHPNIVRLYDSILNSNTPCIIMEYVEGISLNDYLQKKGRISPTETGRIISQVAEALSYLHQRDILHRDIKPANFKIQPDGIVKMLDFGIAKHKYSPKFTQQGFMVGTTEYMAPEMFEQDVNKKSDIWSLGVMMYEMLTGHLPFQANNPLALRNQILKAKFTDPQILVPEIPNNQLEVIEKSLLTNPNNRLNAQQIVKLLNKEAGGTREFGLTNRDIIDRAKNKILSLPNNYLYGILGAVMAILIAILILVKGIDKPVIEGKDEQNQPLAPVESIRINVPSVENAIIVLPDGSQQPLPYSITGKEGDQVEFTIKAEGYADRQLKIEITQRRSSYDITLDKLNY